MSLPHIELLFTKLGKGRRRCRQSVRPTLIIPRVFVMLLPVVFGLIAGQIMADPSKADMLQNLPQFALPTGLNEEQAFSFLMLILFLGRCFC